MKASWLTDIKIMPILLLANLQVGALCPEGKVYG